MDTLVQDFRYAIRGLVRTSGFTAAVVLTLAVAMGATTAVFSVVDHVVMRPLAYRQADRLVAIQEVIPRLSSTSPSVPVAASRFLEWRKSAQSFESLALVGGEFFTLTGSREPESLYGGRVSSSLFPMLGIRPQLGRTFREDEDESGRNGVIMLTDALWRRRFAADPHVVGRKITLDGEPYEIVGVLPAEFHFPALSRLYGINIAGDRPELWKPIGLHGDDLGPGNFSFVCIGRLKPGVSGSQALAELNALQANLAEQLGRNELRARLVPLHEQITGKARLGLQVLFAAVAAVLLIGCVNISNLLLARATDRRREFAIRSAIGASQGRLTRQVLVESLLLSAGGAVLGLAIAQTGLQVLLAHAPGDLPRFDEIRLDTRVFLFALTISIATGLVCGLFPAWHFAKADPQEAMKSASRSATSTRATGRLRSTLVSAEVGLCVVCLIAGGLLLRSLTGLLNVDRGFRAERVITVNFNLPANRYPNAERRTAFARSVLESIQSVPGVESVGIVNRLPLSGQGGSSTVGAEGATTPTFARLVANIRQVNREYFETMGIPLRAGRLFEPSDGDRRVTVISALMAERLWPGQNPLGKRFRIGPASSKTLYDVVGVVGDVRNVTLSDGSSLAVYQPYWQTFFNEGSLAVKTGDPAAVSSGLRAAIHAIDRELPVQAWQMMDDLVLASLAERRFQLSLVLLFGLIAVLLASLGVYGVVAYSVAQRTNEMGIRIALGAAQGNIRALVLRQGLLPVAIGLAVGLVAALGVGQVLKALLFGVTPMDPATLIAETITLSTVSLLACYLPARRATRVDPMVALRTE